jgi:putative membrane protein
MILTKRIDVGKLYAHTKRNLWFLVATCTLTFISTYFVDTTIFKVLSFPTGLVGTALAFLIGFRNNSAYDRWWEARKIWGKLINDSRHFSLKVISFLSNQWNENLSKNDIESAQKRLIYRHIAFVWSVNKHLRKLEWEKTLAPFISEEEFNKLTKEQHIPLALLKNQVLDIKSLYEQKYFEDFRHLSFDAIMENFNDALGKSERIKNTVFPMQYNWYMQYAIWVFLILLPFSLVGSVGLWFLPLSFLIGYVFILLEYLGRHLENPFENHPNDTPIDALSRTIEINLKEVLGETNLPSKIEPLEGKYLL